MILLEMETFVFGHENLLTYRLQPWHDKCLGGAALALPVAGWQVRRAAHTRDSWSRSTPERKMKTAGCRPRPRIGRTRTRRHGRGRQRNEGTPGNKM